MIGPVPQGTMAMQYIGRNNDHGAALDPLAGEFVRSERRATDSGDRRIKPVCLVDDCACLDKPVGKAIDVTIELPVSLRFHALPPLSGLRQEIQRPGNAVRGGFLASGDECQNICANFNLA